MMVHFNLLHLNVLNLKLNHQNLSNLIQFHRCMPVLLVLTTLVPVNPSYPLLPSVRMRGLTATNRKTRCSSGAWPDWRKRKRHRKIAVEARERKRQRKKRAEICGKMQGMLPSYEPVSFLSSQRIFTSQTYTEILLNILVWALHWIIYLLNVLNINVIVSWMNTYSIQCNWTQT